LVKIAENSDYNTGPRLEYQLVSFNVDHLGVNNCDLKFLGIKVFSACGLIQKTIKDSIQKITRDLSEFQVSKTLDLVRYILALS
jgi:hypothetical protein